MLDKIPKSQQKSGKLILRQIPYAETRQEAERLKARFQHWCGKRGLEAAANLIDEDWDRMVTFYNYPKPQWQHLRTTNPVESPFAAPASTNGCGQTLQEGGQCPGHHLEDAVGSRKEISSLKRAIIYLTYQHS